MRTNTDGMRARLSKLEKLLGKGPCACRLERRSALSDTGKCHREPRDASLVVESLCEFCGTPLEYDLSRYPEGLRELARLYHASSLEHFFTDPRAWAAQWWGVFWEAARRQDRRVEAMLANLGSSTPAHPTRGRDGYERRQKALERARALERDPDVKLYRGLLQQARALFVRRFGELEGRYGRAPFPELESRVAAILGADLGPMSALEKSAHAREMLERPACEIGVPWLLCAEMERIVLGDVSAYTAGKIADCERRKQERAAMAAALLAKGRENLWMVEERKERERQERPERERQPPVTPPAQYSPPAPRPAPPPQNYAPAPLAPAAFAPPRRRPKTPRTLQECRRMLEENERRRRS